MVAYSFAPRFEVLIREGMKRQTVRADRNRHARPGERLQLFTGMRTKQCRKIVDDPVCTSVLPIDIRFATGEVSLIRVGTVPILHLDRFAVEDGFEDIADMSAFWREHHGAKDFRGVLIEWAMPDYAFYAFRKTA